MKTKIQVINRNQIDKADFILPSRILKEGGLVAFPTETVYGLGGDGLNPEAAKRIYEAKGRPSDNPLIIHIGNIENLVRLTKFVPEKARLLINSFWPGPLTMIFEKSDIVPYSTTGGLDTVAIRMPRDEIALTLIKKSGFCIAAPSANQSGRPSPTLAKHVIDDLDGKIDMIIDGGAVGIGLESTIVDMTSEIPVILRPGFITKQMIEEVIGEVEVDQPVLLKEKNLEWKPKAPGMKYKHYAPKGDLSIFEGNLDKVTEAINRAIQERIKEHKIVGVIASEETADKYKNGIVKNMGKREDEASIAKKLYEVLREFDDLEVEFIYSESFESENLGQAIMNRLLKAAGYQIFMVDWEEENI